MAAPQHNYPTSAQNIVTPGSEGVFTALQLYDNDRQMRRQLYEKYGFRRGFYMKLKEMGLVRKVKGPVFGHWEQDDIISTIVVGTVTTASTGANTPVVFSLKAESMLTKTIDGATVRFSPIQEQNILDAPSSNVKMIVTAVDRTVNPHRVTVRPQNPAIDLATHVVADTRFYVGPTAFAEATGPAKSVVPTQTRWENNCQILKSRYVESGSSLTNELPWETYGKYKLLKYGHLVEQEQMRQIGLALLTGERSANVTQSSPELNYDPVVKTTQGFLDYAKTEGTNMSHTAGAIDMDHFDAIAEVIRRNKTNTTSVMSMMGFSYRAELENFLKNEFDMDTLTYFGNKFKPEILNGSDPKDYFAWIGFSGLHKNGLNFYFNTIDDFDDINGMGAEGYNYRNLGVHLPFGTWKNKGDNVTIPSIGYVSKELGGYNRDMEWGYTGSANLVQNTDAIDVLRLDLRSEIGFEGILGSQWVYDEVA